MKKYFIGIAVVVMLGLGIDVFADEIGHSSCGKPILIKGEISHYSNGVNYVVSNPTDNSFYTEEVYGSDFTVTIMSIPKGNYTIEIYMAEAYHNSANQRIFNIYHNDKLIADKLDIYAKVGKDTEYLVSHSLQHSSGDLKIRFKADKDQAKFNAFRVLDNNDSLIACVKASELSKVMENPGTGNPFIWSMYTADPSAHEFEGKIYVYPSHDQDNAQGFDMRDYHVFSSEDLLNWEDHGVALDVDDVPWAKEYMWAPDCAYKNGTYYFYFPAKDYNDEFKIGVATGNSPCGPFVAEPEPIKGSFSVDPAVFIDDDGQAYMYFGGAGDGGQTTAWVAKLDSTMKQFEVEAQRVKGLDYWFEACWMQKRNGIYYLSYSMGPFHPQYPNTSTIGYATSDNPLGPFTYRGLINGYVSGWTNHQSTVEYKGQNYFFYHTSDLSGGNTSKRSIAAEYLHFKNDGSIAEIVQTKRGIGSYNGMNRIEAENFYESIGAEKTESIEGGFSVIFDSYDTLSFNNIEFGDAKVNSIQLRIANSIIGVVDIISGEGKKIGSVNVENIDGEEQWKTVNGSIETISGTQDIRLVFKGENDEQLQLNWFEFFDSTATSIGEIIKNNELKVYPNLYSKDVLNVDFPDQIENFQLEIFKSTGQKVFSKWYAEPQSYLHLTNVNIPKGISVIKITLSDKSYYSKFEAI
ncbi:MAG: family 43 glycosylhydrolase [Prolixibacteraceae bacterium]